MTGSGTGEQGRVAVVLGTRPELIKLAPVVDALAATERFELTLVHTEQHYDEELSGVFFDTLGLPEPTHRLDVGSGSHAAQTGRAIAEIGACLADDAPTFTLALGDTNTVLATAVAAAQLPTTFGHVEAGLRSFDRSMPEEINRVLADHVAALLFAPTDTAADNLAAEGLTDGVHVVGNTVVDACRRHRTVAQRESTVGRALGLDPADAVVLATIHRPHNTDDAVRLRTTLQALDSASVPVVCPLHPRTEAAVEAVGYAPSEALRFVEPLDYLDFLALLDAATVVVTDSGGVQEEASVLETPCLTVRPNTERPETVTAGVNELVSPASLSDRLAALLDDEAARTAMTGHPDLYGDGRAAERIVATLGRQL